VRIETGRRTDVDRDPGRRGKDCIGLGSIVRQDRARGPPQSRRADAHPPVIEGVSPHPFFTVGHSTRSVAEIVELLDGRPRGHPRLSSREPLTACGRIGVASAHSIARTGHHVARASSWLRAGGRADEDPRGDTVKSGSGVGCVAVAAAGTPRGIPRRLASATVELVTRPGIDGLMPATFSPARRHAEGIRTAGTSVAPLRERISAAPGHGGPRVKSTPLASDAHSWRERIQVSGNTTSVSCDTQAFRALRHS
jgi:hypothetical protein